MMCMEKVDYSIIVNKNMFWLIIMG